MLIHWGLCAIWAEPLLDEPSLRRPLPPPALPPGGVRRQRRHRGSVRMAEHAAHCAAPHARARDRARARRRVTRRASRSHSSWPSMHRTPCTPSSRWTPRDRPADRSAGRLRPRVRGARSRALSRRRQGRRRRHIRPRRLRTRLPRPARARTPGRVRASRRRRGHVLHAGAARTAAVVVHRGGREAHHAARARCRRGEQRSDLSGAAASCCVSWLPDVEPFELPGATHLLHLENPRGMAEALASFFARHPLTARR